MSPPTGAAADNVTFPSADTPPTTELGTIAIFETEIVDHTPIA